MTGSILIEGQAYSYNRQLADGFGPRLTGSDAYGAAADWAERQFKSLGLKVHIEMWTIPAAWEPQETGQAQMIAPRRQILHLQSLGWSPSTPLKGITGKVVYVKDVLNASSLRAQAAEIRGNIALVDQASFALNGPLPLGTLIANLQSLSSLGAKALIMGYGPPNNLISQKGLEGDGRLTPLPTAGLGQEDTALIRRLLQNGPVTMSFSFTNHIRPNVTVKTVVAELPGRETSNDWVLLGAHLDSWHPGTGAQDNGSGVAVVMEAARAIMASGRPPRRSLRFVLFGGEEEGLLGSREYVRAHRRELQDCTAALITDLGAGPPLGWYSFGQAQVEKDMAAIEPLLRGLGAAKLTDDNANFFDSDHSAFLSAGVPSLFMWTDHAKYDQVYHLPADTFDKVNERDLDLTAAAFAATAYAVADLPVSFGKHLSPPEVMALFAKAHVLEQYKSMVANGLL
ncbi:M20/M25/M40 family metallo-hydrolase [Rhodanobacter sp. Col0626]|uniref:M20/M25/M40 family metallo-hydrolase n=1 Tax=Rhodanobacter sp. Col0626 TaxID=3415679 RepID=UPI003CFAEF27